MSVSKYIPTKKRQHILGIVQQPNQMSIYYHQNNLLEIKKELGSKCTYISHVRYPSDQYGIVAKFGKDHKPIKAMLNGTPNDIKGEYYSQLKIDMKNEARKRGIL